MDHGWADKELMQMQQYALYSIFAGHASSAGRMLFVMQVPVQLAGGFSPGAPSGFAFRTPVSGPPYGHLMFCSGPPLLRAVDLSKCASEAGGSR